MIKKLCIFISSFIIMISPIFILNCSAAVVDIETPLHEPVPIYEVLSDRIHIKFYWVGVSQNVSYLYEADATFPLGTNLYFMKTGTGSFCSDQQTLTYHWNVYRMDDGYLHQSFDNSMASYEFTSDGITYKYLNFVGMYEGSFYYPDSAAIKIDLPLYAQKYNITWSPEIVPLNHYESYISEPFCDELNRYFVLAGEENQYIYVLRYFMSEAYIYQVENSIDPNNTVQAFLKNLVCPYVDLNNNGLQLSLNVDSDLFLLLNSITQSTYLFYDLQVAKYNLLDGQFIQSWVYTDIEMSSDPVVLDVDLGNPEDYDSVQFWGVMYQDTSTRYHYNLLSCSWAQDPDFITWRTSIENYLDLIYTLLSETEESATIDMDTSELDEMQSARDQLEVTDENGESIDPAEQVEVAFSEAASGLGQISGGVESVNGMITDLFAVHPLVIVPIIVALALGLIVTILGKDKSD